MDTIEKAATGEAYALPKDRGVTDLWWPYGPAAGRYTIKVSGEQTDGSLLQFLLTDSRGAAAPLHIHHDTDETWYVIEGELTVFVGNERFEVGAGGFVLGPKGVPHTFIVTSERAEVLVTYGPAGTKGPSGYGVAGFFQEVADPVVPGQAPPEPTEPADPQDFARRMMVYGIELVGPPPALD
jgi:mannose-6-phosphate isomerase-like protein (cupin superfamily)